MWFWDKPLFSRFFFLPTTHTAVISLLSTTSSENWGSYELYQEGQVLWSSFFVATAAYSGFLGNGQCSEPGCLGEADNQLCGGMNECFTGLRSKDLGSDIPVSSFMDCYSFWSLRIVLDIINQSQKRTDFFFFFPSLHPLFYGVSLSFFFNVPVIKVLETTYACRCCELWTPLELADLTAGVCRQKGPLHWGTREVLLQGRQWMPLETPATPNCCSPGGRFEPEKFIGQFEAGTQGLVIPRGLLINSIDYCLRASCVFFSSRNYMSSSFKKCLSSPVLLPTMSSSVTSCTGSLSPWRTCCWKTCRMGKWGWAAPCEGRSATMREVRVAVPLDLWSVFGSGGLEGMAGWWKRRAVALEANCVSVVFHHLELV